jgi:hypothetical protein
MNANLRIFFDFRSFDHFSIGSHVGDRLAELVANGLVRFRFQEKLMSRSEFRDRARVFGCCCCGFTRSVGPVATVVDELDVCAKATEPIRAVANATLTIDLIIETNFLVY